MQVIRHFDDMKKINLSVLILLSIAVLFISKISGSTLDDGYDISVKINHFKDTVAYLGYHFGDQKFVKDTASAGSDNMIRFRGDEVLKPGIYFVYSPSVYFELIINDQQFSIETDTADFIKHMKVEGSPENKIFNDFQQYMSQKQQQTRELSQKLQALDNSQDAEEISAIREQLANIGKEIESYQADLITHNGGTFVARLVKAMQKPKVPDPPTNEAGEVVDKNFQFFYYKSHFFDGFDLSDPGLLRTPLYQSKIDEYLDKLTYQHPDSLSQAADNLLSRAASNDETFRYLLVKLTNKYETSNIMGMERVFVYLAENYYLKGKAFWADDELVEKFEKRVKELKPNLVGNTAPEMILRDTLMRPVRLSDLNSRFTILYFYDPDCGHCKKVTPQLRDMYPRMKEKNVEVFAACTITDTEKWKKYIRDNNLPFINVSDPYYQSNFRADYDIKSTPKIFVLDKEKEIIAKRLGIDQLEDFINRMIEFEDNDKS